MILKQDKEILSSWLKDKRLKPAEVGQYNAMQWGSEGLISMMSAPFRWARPKCPNFYQQEDEKTKGISIMQQDGEDLGR